MLIPITVPIIVDKNASVTLAAVNQTSCAFICKYIYSSTLTDFMSTKFRSAAVIGIRQLSEMGVVTLVN